MLHDQVDQLKLIAINRDIEKNQRYTTWETARHTQNIQIKKVTGENEKCVFYFMEKTKRTFWPTQQ